MSSRRQFLSRAALAPAVRIADAQTTVAAPRRFIIDSHQHFEDQPDYVRRLADQYTPRNAMACVCGPIQHLEALRGAAKTHPNVVIPYGQISVDDTAALHEIEKFAAAGFKGMKMHTPRRNWDDPQYFPLFAKLQEHSMVALFHTGVSYREDGPHFTSMARMRPAYLDTISRAFPSLYIQGAHLGNPWYEEAAEAARWAPLLYFDVTGSTLIKKEKNLAVFKDYLWWKGPGQHSSPGAVYAPPENLDVVLGRYEAMLNACDVPEESRRRIYGGTMAAILGIRAR